MDTINADEIVQTFLLKGNQALSEFMKADVMFISTAFEAEVDDEIRSEIEYMKEKKESLNKLCVVLQTPGGFIEVVERVVSVFRRNYPVVEFIVPNFAYSAGTVLALSGDEIYMDYYSVLGPIDPQFMNESGKYVPGMGYLAKYEELMDRINSNRESVDSIRAEMAFLLKKFDPAELFRIEQSIEHSKSLLKEWLPKYKFKNWCITDSRNLEVTPGMKEERAVHIAESLGNAKRWHSHGRGICRDDLESDEIGLKTVDFGANPDLKLHVRHYDGLCRDYMARRGFQSALHTHRGLRRIV